MADMLNVAVSGLRAFQRALDTTGHNIANATTPGYSRQRVELATMDPTMQGGLNIGSGVKVASIDRYYDALVATNLRGATSDLSRLSTYAGKAEQVNNLFGDSSTGLSATLRKFDDALQGVANQPTSTAARQVLLGEATALSQRLQSYDQRLKDLDSGIDASLRNEATAITTGAQNIARLNEQIVRQQSTTGSPPNDLLDQRDRELTELAKHVSITSVAQDDGSLNVFIGSGQSLVVGSQAGTVATATDPYLPTRQTLVYQTTGGSADLRNVLNGGTVGGLMDFRREMLDPARNQIGQIAVGLASSINAQHHEGMDLTGALGGDLFAVGGVGVQPSLQNGGSATVAVTRTNVGAMTASDYLLTYDGSAWNLTRADTGAAVPMTGNGSSANPFAADGLSFVVSGTPASGDRILVQPTAGAVNGMRVLISDPAKIAAAAPIRSSAAATNLGNGTISAGEVLDAGNAQLRSTVTLQFTDATHYSINGAGSYSYASGGNIDVNGWRVAISGNPQAGDTFTVANNAGGVGDNRNALALSSTLGQGLFSNGTESLNSATTRILGSVGTATAQAQMSRDAQQVIHDDAVSENDAISGVNLDEEAADMLRYQQAYQAAAQVIRATQAMFDSLLMAVQR